MAEDEELALIMQGRLLAFLLSCSFILHAAIISEVRLAHDLIKLEDIRFREIAEYLQAGNVSVQGFFHMSRISENWQSILKEQLLLMSGFHRDQNPKLDKKRIATRLDSKPQLPESAGLISILEKLNIIDAAIADGRPIFHKELGPGMIVDSLEKVSCAVTFKNCRTIFCLHMPELFLIADWAGKKRQTANYNVY